MPAARRKPVLPNIVLAVVLLVPVYVLSYAPALRLMHSRVVVDHPFMETVIPHVPGYAPVEWLIDNTPMREPLLRWGDLWGCGDDMRFSSDFRP
jgi:hypothetical protein